MCLRILSPSRTLPCRCHMGVCAESREVGAWEFLLRFPRCASLLTKTRCALESLTSAVILRVLNSIKRQDTPVCSFAFKCLTCAKPKRTGPKGIGPRGGISTRLLRVLSTKCRGTMIFARFPTCACPLSKTECAPGDWTSEMCFGAYSPAFRHVRLTVRWGKGFWDTKCGYGVSCCAFGWVYGTFFGIRSDSRS